MLDDSSNVFGPTFGHSGAHFDDPAPAPPLRGESSSASSRKRPRPPDPRLQSTTPRAQVRAR